MFVTKIYSIINLWTPILMRCYQLSQNQHALLSRYICRTRGRGLISTFPALHHTVHRYGPCISQGEHWAAAPSIYYFLLLASGYYSHVYISRFKVYIWPDKVYVVEVYDYTKLFRVVCISSMHAYMVIILILCTTVVTF